MKRHRFFYSVVSLFLIFLLAGCATYILKKPEVMSVKKLAIVSIYANKAIYNVKAPTTADTDLLSAVLKTEAGGQERAARQQALSYGYQVFAERLNEIGSWDVLPPDRIINNEKYQELTSPGDEGTFMGKLINAFAKFGMGQWDTPEGIIYIPIESVVERGSKTVYLGKDKKSPEEEAREKLASLAQELGVDAVAILKLDVAYEFPKIKFTGPFGKSNAKANVTYDMVAVSKEGGIVIDTKGDAGRFKSPNNVAMVDSKTQKGGYYHSKGKTVEQVNLALQEAAADLKERIEKELEKG